VRRVAVSSDQRCPLCRGDVAGAPADELAVCVGCDAVHHGACVAELAGGSCATLGCGRPLGEAQVPRAEEVRDGARALVVGDLKAFLLASAEELVVLWVVGVVLVAFVALVVFDVTEMRWLRWALPAATIGPLLLVAAWCAIRDFVGPASRPRRPGK
jgi:hypothetical protein